MLLHWIWLAERTGLRYSGASALLRRFGGPEQVYYAQEAELRSVPELEERALPGLLDKALTKSEEILTACYDKKINILTIQDGAYPNRLRNIPDPPLVLYYRGTIPAFDAEPVIGVVGTRKASPYGLLVAKRMGYQIAQCGGLVVSGLADGIDSMAMVGALTDGKPAVGVLGCGADVVYPRSNQSLYADVAARGCLLTEYPPGTPPLPYNFPRRNRIISGLSCGVLVVEAPEKSGALITAQCALDQGRDVFTVPGNIDVPSCAGSNRLLREGAIAVSSGWEILEEYEAQFPGRIVRFLGGTKVAVSRQELVEIADGGPLSVAESREGPTEKIKLPIDKRENRTYSCGKEAKTALTPDEQSVLSALEQGRLPVDEVIVQSGLPAARALASLTLLEVKGLVRRMPGKIYELAGK